MKNLLAMLFFLGLTTTGFSQTRYGDAILLMSAPGTIHLRCESGVQVCYSLTFVHDSFNRYRLQVPKFHIDYIVSPNAYVNDIPVQDLPADIPGSESDEYIITFEQE